MIVALAPLKDDEHSNGVNKEDEVISLLLLLLLLLPNSKLIAQWELLALVIVDCYFSISNLEMKFSSFFHLKHNKICDKKCIYLLFYYLFFLFYYIIIPNCYIRYFLSIILTFFIFIIIVVVVVVNWPTKKKVTLRKIL